MGNGILRGSPWSRDNMHNTGSAVRIPTLLNLYRGKRSSSHLEPNSNVIDCGKRNHHLQPNTNMIDHGKRRGQKRSRIEDRDDLS